MIFVMLFNLLATMLAGLGVFAWGVAGQSFAPNWGHVALLMIGSGLVTGIFGMLTQSTAIQIYYIFFSFGGIAFTASTMSWLGLPIQIIAVVTGIVGMLGCFAIAQILTGVPPD
jgi:hypothetical protein